MSAVPAKAGTHTPRPRHWARPVQSFTCEGMGPRLRARLRGDDQERSRVPTSQSLMKQALRRLTPDAMGAEQFHQALPPLRHDRQPGRLVHDDWPALPDLFSLGPIVCRGVLELLPALAGRRFSRALIEVES